MFRFIYEQGVKACTHFPLAHTLAPALASMLATDETDTRKTEIMNIVQENLSVTIRADRLFYYLTKNFNRIYGAVNINFLV